MKKNLGIWVALLCVLAVQSCKQSPEEYGKKWTADLKAKIMKESGLVPDSRTVDSTRRIITYSRNNVRLRAVYYAPRETESDKPGQPRIIDSTLFVYYSTSQLYQFVVTPCVGPAGTRSYETVAMNGASFGWVEYVDCSTKVKEVGFHHNNDNIGTWIKYDADGNEIQRVEAGNEEKLEIFKTLKF